MTPSGIEPATFRFVAQNLNHCATAVPKRTVLVGIFDYYSSAHLTKQLHFVIFINKKYTNILTIFIKRMKRSITKTIFLVVMTIKLTSGKASGGNRFYILLRICLTCRAAVQASRSTFNCFRNKHESELERGHHLRRLNL